MARGMPGVWSTVLGLPFIITGGWLYTGQNQYPPTLGLPFVVFGLFIVGVGAYIHFLAPSKPRLQDGEEILEVRHPTQRVAFVKVAMGMPLLVMTVYLFFFTFSPYVYPTVTLLGGLYFFSVGLHTYWTNTLTTYMVTNHRVIKEYRFLSLIRQEIPHSKLRGVQERKSMIESMVGLGNVRVASGGGRTLEIIMANMNDSEGFADTIRSVL